MNKRVDELLEIIKHYEEHGFKDQLFKKIAEANEENADDYIDDGGIPISETAKYLSWYETTVQNRRISFSKKTRHLDDFFEAP